MGEPGVRGRLFGTDGVRGVAGQDLTARLAMDLSVAAAAVLAGAPPRRCRRTRPAASRVAVVGRDPRASGEFLEAAVVAGLASAGVDVLRLGVLPTPGVAYLTGALNADFGVVISASHNPARTTGSSSSAAAGSSCPTPSRTRSRPSSAPAEPRHGLRPGLGRQRHPRAVPGAPAVQPARRAGPGPGGPADSGRLRARGGLPGRPGGAAPRGGAGHHDRCRAGRGEHQRRLRLDPPGPAGRGGRGPRRGRRRGLRR